jgi:hypothetical protein
MAQPEKEAVLDSGGIWALGRSVHTTMFEIGVLATSNGVVTVLWRPLPVVPVT